MIEPAPLEIVFGFSAGVALRESLLALAGIGVLVAVWAYLRFVRADRQETHFAGSLLLMGAALAIEVFLPWLPSTWQHRSPSERCRSCSSASGSFVASSSRGTSTRASTSLVVERAGFEALFQSRPNVAEAISRVLAARQSELRQRREAAPSGEPFDPRKRLLARMRSIFRF